MSERSIGRRQVLTGAGVAAGGVAVTGLGMAAPAAAHNGSHGRTGSWLCTRKDDPPADQTEAQFVLSLARGGVLGVLDINPAPGTALGTWAPVGDHGFRGTSWAGFPASDTDPAVTVRVKARGEAARHTIQGTYRYVVFDAASGAELFAVTGSFTGRRIVP